MKKSMILGAALLTMFSAGAQKYNMVVETTDGQKTVIPVDNIASMSMTAQPNYVEADHFVYGLYTTQASAPDRATYRLDFANAPTEDNLPVNVGDMVVSIEFTAPVSADMYQPQLPAGNYGPGNNSANFTYNCLRSDVAIRTAPGNGEDAISYEVIIGGYIDVNYVDNEYDIRAELITLNGLELNVSYNGPATFANNPINSEYFTEDVNVNFEGAQGRYYANWYYHYADDMMLQLYTGNFNADGSQIDGYWLNIELYLPKAADPRPEALPSPRIADGVYHVDTREDAGSFYFTYHPFSFVSGKVIDFMGMPANIGTVITYKEAAGRTKIAHISGGTLTVSENGTKFVLDFTTDEGVKITGTYSGTPETHNFCNNFDYQPARPFSSISADYNLHFADNAIALAYDEGYNFLCPGKKSVYLMVSDPNMLNGDYIAFDLTADDNGLVDGTYTVNDTFEPFSVLKGHCDYGGGAIYSWFGNLEDLDSDGYNNIMAPIDGGTFTVATDAQGVTTITFNLLDDKGNKITGSWSGNVIRVSDDMTETQSLRKLKFRK